MEVKSEAGGQSFKTIEILKKTLLHDESSEKSVKSEEISILFVELIKSVSALIHKPNNSHAISQAIEILVHSCSNKNHHIRGAAAENLRKLIKNLMGTHFSRIQQDLFHELKKNGESRSVCVALECFSSLFPLTRPSRCSMYAQNLVPVLLRIIGRPEESIHEGLQDAFLKITPTLTPFLSTVNIKAIIDGIINYLKTAPPSYRRMASSALTNIIQFSKNSIILVQWLIKKLLDLGCELNASSDLVTSLLMILQQLLTLVDVPFSLLKQVYCYVLSCILYRDTNTIVSGLECLHQLLSSVNAEFLFWLTSPLPNGQAVMEFWSDSVDSDSYSRNDSSSLGEDLDMSCDNYFEAEKASSALSESITSLQERSISLSISEFHCMALKNEFTKPLQNLLQYLMLKVLSSHRVSIQSLGLACITCTVAIDPDCLTSLEFITTFVKASDPKLRSNAVKLLACIISSQLRIHRGNFSDCHGVASIAYNYLYDFVNDDTAIVLKSYCEALRLCLPMLSLSSEPQRVLDILYKLLPLCESPYWLTKVELLQTLSCLDFTIIALFEENVPESILSDVVFKLIGDNDYRVRSMACECLVSLVSKLTLDGNPLLAHLKRNTRLFSHLYLTEIEFSFAGVTDTLVKQNILPPIGLDHILWYLMGYVSSSTDPMLQKGCLEALHLLSTHYPPTSLPLQWGCTNQPCPLIVILYQLLDSCRLAWGVQGHIELLELSSSIFLSCGLVNVHNLDIAEATSGVFKDETMVQFADYFLSHNIKLLSIFVHIIEERQPEPKDKKIQLGISPKKQGSTDLPSPNKSKPTQLLQESLNIKPPLVPKDGLGHFFNLPHFMKLYDACKAAYTNFQVSLGLVGTDKFSKLLQVSHKSLAALLEIAVADDIGKNVEEILLYIGFTIKIDPSGALLCVQQLLNALFGMNTAAQHTHLYSPFISSLNSSIGNVKLMQCDTSLYSVAISDPIALMMNWIKTSSLTSSPLLSEERTEGKKSSTPLKKALIMKPVNSASDIKDYIAFFEPLVVYALNHFPYTSSLLLQQRVLFLVVQLLHLKVRYDLLDCNHSFFESVIKLIGLMETGMVKGGEALVPHLFQFLVLLASDQSKLVSVPQVMQMCDGVMASGHNVTTFAIPALQPLVLNLFVRSTRLSSDIDIQREVALNMLLRLIEHARVIVLLTHVLDCYRKKKLRWQEVSNKIYAALLPRIGKLQVILDEKESLVAFYQLFMAMSPHTINVQGLMTALMKQTLITSSECLLRWLAVVCTLLELMGSTFHESSLSNNISSLHLGVPEFRSPLLHVSKSCILSAVNNELSSLAWFFRNSLLLAVNSLNQVNVQQHQGDFDLLPVLTGNILLLLQILLGERYPNLKKAFSALPDYDELTDSFLCLSTFHPLLTLHYINFLLLVNPSATDWLKQVISEDCSSSSSRLIQHGAIVSVCYNYSDSIKHIFLSISKSPALLTHCNKNVTQAFLRCIKNDTETSHYLYDSLKLVGGESVSQLLQYIYIASNVLSPKTVKFLCVELIPHPLSVIWQAAVIVANRIINDPAVTLSIELAGELLGDLNIYNERCPELIIKLKAIAQVDTQPSNYSFVEGGVFAFNKEWCVKMIADFCSSAEPSHNNEIRAHVLSLLGKDDLDVVFEQIELPLSLLECCIVHGISLSLNLKNPLNHNDSIPIQQEYLSSSPGDTIHSLLEVSVKQLSSRLKMNPLNCGLTRCFVRLLSGCHNFHTKLLDSDSNDSLRDLCLHSLKSACIDNDPLAIRTSIDCCSLVLHLPEFQKNISEKWAKEAVCCLYSLTCKVYRMKLPGVSNKSGSETDLDMDSIKDRLLATLSVILKRDLVPTSYTLHDSLKHLTFSLCRLSLWHGILINPPVLKGEGVVSYKVLDEALKESEVLLEFMQRSNCLGWLTRSQFEERWMQLLGVINQPHPNEDASPEEHHAYSLNVCAGLQAITSLLLATTLRPHMGDPTSSIPMSVHRNNEMLFLGSRPGRRLTTIRKKLELETMFQSDARTNLYSYYQSPLLEHYSSTIYPPLYTKNVEKYIGSTSISYGQISLRSLWSIIFRQLPSGYHSDSEEIDVKSCILSLIDHYIHWLKQPIHTVLLNYTLQSIVMLSDLFAVSSQFQWMLHTLMNLYENHPQEDTHTTSLIVVGTLKAVAVLKSEVVETEKYVKIVEKSLTSDISIQISCVRGILYLSEDSDNALIPSIISTVTKYLLTTLQNFLSITEDYLMILWALTVDIITNHSQHLKDQSFTSKMLELITQIMMHQNISTALFSSITLGLELLVLNFSLSNQERIIIINAASNRFIKSDQNKSLAALSLLLSCMYTGDEAGMASGLAEPISNPMETAIQAREQVNNLMERLRHGSEIHTRCIADILPQVIIDFLPPMEVLQTVVTDFVSPHQSRPQLSASIMAETFALLIKNGQQTILSEWIVLSLESFVQQEPETKAVWSITCLLLAASTNDAYRSLFYLVCYQKQLNDSQALHMLCLATKDFYVNQCNEQNQELILNKFRISQYPSLGQVAQYCLT